MNRPSCLGSNHPPLRGLCGWVAALSGLMCAGSTTGQPVPATPTGPAAGAAASAPAAPTSPVPTVAIKTNATPSDADKALLDKFVADRAAVLGRDDGKARDELLTAAASGSVKDPASAPYLALYTNTLNRELLPLLASKDVRIRMNVAIVVAKVAAAAQNAWLQPTVEKLLTDSSDGTVLWAMKAAAAILPQPGARADELINKIVNAVKAHAGSGAIADEAYSALASAASPPTSKTIGKMQDLYKLRLAAYAKGIPDDPTAERKPSVYLTAGGAQGMWTLSTPAQQVQTMTLIREALRSGRAQADIAPLGDLREQLLYMLGATCTAVQVVGIGIADNALAGDAKIASKNLPANTPPGQVVGILQPVVDGITRVWKLPP